MKYIGSVLLFNFLFTAQAADEFFLRSSFQVKDVLNLTQLDSMKVNEVCHKNEKDCLLQIKIGLKNKPKSEVDHIQAGNPASQFCHQLGGASLIVEDKIRNEYDFCKFSGKYLIDSWDLYKKYKR